MQEKENRKTLTYLLVAGMALLVAWEPWRQVAATNAPPDAVGKKLFEDFKDPLAAKSLDIVKFDEDTATIRPFRVAQINGVWSIPSHSNYPADAQQHMAEAANALLDVKILGLDSSNPGDRELYGVITPDPQQLKPGTVGVGTRITLKDAKDNPLADVVIGKDVKDRPGQRYVRKTDRDQIYRVEIKTDKLSTKFEDWIEKDLLKLNAFDVREVELNDYSAGAQASNPRQLGVNMRSRMKLGYDDAKSSWNLVEMSEYDPMGKPVAVELAEDEELNNEKLNGMKTALDDLQIVDVERKPTGLSQDLRVTDEFVNNREAVASLAERGFYPATRDGQLAIYSSEGEATCTAKDGVRYVLRFGQLAGGAESKEEKAADGKAAANPALNRYLFLMAQFDESQIPKPELQPVPGGDQPEEEKPAEDKPDAKAADEAKPEAKEETVPEEKTADDETKDEKATEPANEAAPAKEAAPADAKAEEKPAEEKPKSLTQAEQERITVQRENKRKQEEYDASIKKGQDRVKELNDRFADWYFIISDDVYKKIHLGRADVVKKKGAKEEAAAENPAALEQLKAFEKGLPK